jgi:hypothetical protein
VIDHILCHTFSGSQCSLWPVPFDTLQLIQYKYFATMPSGGDASVAPVTPGSSSKSLSLSRSKSADERQPRVCGVLVVLQLSTVQALVPLSQPHIAFYLQNPAFKYDPSAILQNPIHNKGTAFTLAERESLHLRVCG